MSDGSLQARAAHRWISNETTLAKAWKNEPAKESHPKPQAYDASHDIWRADWQKSLDLKNDLLLWNLKKSNLYITTCRTPIQRIMFRDVRFLKDDVKRIFSFLNNNEKSNFYRANKINEWRRFWHEMLIIAADGKHKLNDSKISEFTTDEQIIDTVYNRLSLHDAAAARDRDDSETAAMIDKQLSFSLSNHAMMQEVKLLRQALGLKRRYTKRGSKLGLGKIDKPGSAGRTSR